MNFKRISITEAVLNALLVFSCTSVIQGISAFDDINKIWMVLVSFLLLVCMVFYTYTATQVMMLYLTAVLHIAALYYTAFPLHHFNMLFYFLLWVLVYTFFAKSRNAIQSSMGTKGLFIQLVLIIWTLMVGASAFLPSSYEGRYFISFTDSSFRLMPTVLIIEALAMYMAISRRDRRYEWFLVLPTYACFMNESRAYFVIYILFLIMYLYMGFKSKRNFYLMLIPILAAVVLLMSVTGIMDKLLATRYTESSYFDFWGTLTNGRTLFWRWDMEAFFDLPFYQQLIGNGFNFVYDVNIAFFNAEIWAHNDIINLLMNFGYLGVVVYLWAYCQLTRAYLPKESRVPLMVRLLFHGAVWFNSLTNMSYTYVCAMISYPLFLCAISEKYTADAG